MRFKRFLCAALTACLLAMFLPGLSGTALAVTPYYITVDRTNQIVTVYDSGNVSTSGIVRQMICSTGKSGTPTPAGTYTLPAKQRASERTEWYYFPAYSCYAKWATRIVGGILFHSVLYTSGKVGPTRSSVNALGSPASHGCVRLRVADAKWIAQNCLAGTRVRIYSSGASNPGLRSLLLNGSFSRGSQSYESFLNGVPASPQTPAAAPGEAGFRLALGSRGDYVVRLQTRLKALGFLNDTADGDYGLRTLNAVRRFQKASGLTVNGEVDSDLWNRIFAAGAPSGTAVTLNDGMTGPAIVALQEALTILKMYSGPIDGLYSQATTEAVRYYQTCFCLYADGIADSALQADIIARANAVQAQFPDEEYQMNIEVTDAPVGIVNASVVTLRSRATRRSQALARMRQDEVVELLGEQRGWSQVRYGVKVGYVQTRYLTLTTRPEPVITYAPVAAGEEAAGTVQQTQAIQAAPETTPEPTLEPTAPLTPEPTAEPPAAPTMEPVNAPTVEPTAAPTASPAVTPAPTAAVTPAPTRPPRYAVTRRDSVKLYAEPKLDERLVVAELPLGTALEVQSTEGEWVSVPFEREIRFLRLEDVTLTDVLPEATPAPVEAPPTVAEPAAPEPTVELTIEPTLEPTAPPTLAPTAEPSVEPTSEPTLEPSVEPTVEPTTEPTLEPSVEPTVEPTSEPTLEPTVEPTPEPTVAPTPEPTAEPTEEPTVAPTPEPTVAPTPEPTSAPTPEPAPEPVVESAPVEETMIPEDEAA